MSNELPPLPRPFVPGDEANPRDFYTADQMREYGRACERAAYERAIKAVKDVGGDDTYYHVDAIRALVDDK